MLVTVPLGVLKKGSIRFSPPLPQRKLGAIQRMGFGVLNKARAVHSHKIMLLIGRVPMHRADRNMHCARCSAPGPVLHEAQNSPLAELDSLSALKNILLSAEDA